MGVPGLHTLIKPIAEPGVHLSRLAGKAAAVDASSWLHKGMYGCALELLQGQATDQFLEVPRRMVGLLREHGITPHLVFDGRTLPIKAERAADAGGRRDERSRHHARAIELLRAGRDPGTDAELRAAPARRAACSRG